MDYRPKCKTRNCKTPRREHRLSMSLSDINDSNVFFPLDLSPKGEEIKINLRGLFKFKNLYTAKKTINKARKPMEWEKIFANDMNDKWLISKVYKQPSSNSIS